MNLVEAWSFTPLAQLAGLGVPDEGPALFAWDTARRLYVLRRDGRPSATELLPFLPAAGAVSRDGRTLAFIADDGRLLICGADGSQRQSFELEAEPTALALDAFGQWLLVSWRSRAVALFDRELRERHRIKAPRPLVHLAFGHRRAVWFGAAAQGHVCEHDALGAELRRDAILFECGGLAADLEDHVWLACHGGGLRSFPSSPEQRNVPVPLPCERIAAAPSGRRLATLATAPGADRSTLALHDAEGTVLASRELPCRGAFLGLPSRGDELIVGLADGAVLSCRIEPR